MSIHKLFKRKQLITKFINKVNLGDHISLLTRGSVLNRPSLIFHEKQDKSTNYVRSQSKKCSLCKLFYFSNVIKKGKHLMSRNEINTRS